MSLHHSDKLRTNPDPKLPLGTNRCLCASCGCYFGGVRAFELHRTRVGPAADRACLPPGGVRDKRNRPLLRLDKYDYWVQIDKPVHLRQPVVLEAA